ncbi:MAG: hypothetical protein H8E66_27310 [Planctomycetes bacterium]|nr:hypothetical protein [Planctomycetota bacterium]
MRMNRSAVASLALIVLSFSSFSWAQDADPLADPAAVPAVAADAKPTPWREQTIYIPYKQLQKVFEEQGRGVFVPYEKFQELWKKAQASEPRPVDDRPPLGAIVTEIASEATVERDVINVQASVQIELLGKGWHEVPLRLSDAAIRSATIENEPARVLSAAKMGYKLLVQNINEIPRRLTLDLEYSKAYSKSPGQNSVSLEAPQAPVNRWLIRIPQSGVKVNIQPMIAATEAPANVADEDDPPKETVVLAFVGAASTVRVDWTPKTEGAAGLEALATVQAQQEVSIDEGVVRTRTRLAYEISRAELSQLVVEAPLDQKVTRVLDPNVKKWEVARDDAKQTITIDLFQPARGTQSIIIDCERFSDETALRETHIPVIQAVNVGRQQGVVVVRLGDELRAEATTKNGLLQLDTAELPQPLQSVKWAFAYRYAALPFDLALSVEKVKPRIQVQQLVEAYLQPEQITLDVSVILDIQQAGVFELAFDIPAGYQVERVQGRAMGDAKPVVVDSHHVEGDDNTRLQINLSRKAMGRVGVSATLRRSLNEPNLMTPTGEAAEIQITIPRIATEVEDVSGSLIVHGPESLQITSQSVSGMRNVAIAETHKDVQAVRDGRFEGLREILGFVFTIDPAELTVAAERRRPHVTARQLLTAGIETGVIKYEARFFYDILYSAVKSLRLDVPEDLAVEIRVASGGVSKTTITPQPDDVPEGYVAWSLRGESEFLGQRNVVLSWEQSTQELEVGKSTDYALPSLMPMNVDRAWGQIVVSKAETLDVRAAAGFDGLRPIDPQHDLMPGVSVTDAARAFEFHDAWTLSVTTTRYELEEVKRTSIERALVRMVVTRSDRVSVQALYRIRSAVQRLAVALPAESEFDNDPLYINGEPKSLEHGEQNQLFIPLVNQNPEVPFVLELRYTMPGDHRQLDMPAFPGQPGLQTEPAMQKVELSVFLPNEMALLDSDGPWTNQQGDWYSKLNRLPGHRMNDDHLLGWVTEGVGMKSQHATTFAVDGRLYSFTTLRPAPPPNGSLQLVAWDARALNFLVFASIAVVGLVFVRRSANNKLIVLAAILIGLVIVGVFAPTFAMQLIDGYLLLAVFLVLVVWAVSGVLMRKPRTVAAPAESANATDVTDETPVEQSPEEGQTPFQTVDEPQEQGESDVDEGGPSDA